MRRDLELLGEGGTPWLREFAASAQYSGNSEVLLDAAVCYCALEGVGLDVPGKHFVDPTPATPPPVPTEQTIAELLRQLQARGSALENLTKKLEAVGAHGKTRDEPIPTLCRAEFEELMAILSQAQWVVRTHDVFHKFLIGVPAISSDARCTRDGPLRRKGLFQPRKVHRVPPMSGSRWPLRPTRGRSP